MAAVGRLTVTVDFDRAAAALAVIRDAATAGAIAREGPTRLRERLAAVGELAGRALAEAEAREGGPAGRAP